eukprot:sb/3467818/
MGILRHVLACPQLKGNCVTKLEEVEIWGVPKSGSDCISNTHWETIRDMNHVIRGSLLAVGHDTRYMEHNSGVGCSDRSLILFKTSSSINSFTLYQIEPPGHVMTVSKMKMHDFGSFCDFQSARADIEVAVSGILLIRSSNSNVNTCFNAIAYHHYYSSTLVSVHIVSGSSANEQVITGPRYYRVSLLQYCNSVSSFLRPARKFSIKHITANCERGQNQNWTSLLEVVEISSASILPFCRNNPCVLLTPTKYQQQNARRANLYYLQQTCPILILSTLTLICLK